MATVKLTPTQKQMLESLASGALLIPHSYNKMVVMSLVKKGLMQATKTYNVGSDYELTEAGRSLLGLEPLSPMVDQPQPAPVNNDYDYSAEWDAYVTQREREHFNSIDYGSDENTIIDDNNDLPFSDLGELDDEDTKELPAITVDAPKPTLSNLIDAALNPDDTDAYAALKEYDWKSVPLWVLEIERDDINAYKWEIWHELRKMNGGILLSNPDAVYKGREVDRAFNVMAILNNAIYSNYKGVGFNVLD